MHASAFQNVCRLRYCMSGFLVKLLNARESYILYIWGGGVGGGRRPRKTGTKALIIYPREKFYEIRIKETLSLNALRVTDPVILCDIR